MKGDSFTGKAAFPAPFMRSCPYQAIMRGGLLEGERWKEGEKGEYNFGAGASKQN
jgi:hypothetical protein